jgi:16S rRNA (guanine966-N2)-methyltransferase
VSRIVGGVAGGRRLVTRQGRGTRPTSERAREGLFSSLGGDLTGRSFLDLFAGSGAVGLEAASRGAAPVVLVERDPAALTAMRANVEALGLGDITVAGQPVERLLAVAPAAPFDIVFLDPPYADPVEPVLQLLLAGSWLAAEALVVVERTSREDFGWPSGIAAERSRRYGDSTLWYGRRP